MAKTTGPKRCYDFGEQGTDGDARQKALLGGKGANLAEMSATGLPVPPGFTITTETCAGFLAGGVAKELAVIRKKLERWPRRPSRQ